MNDVYRIHMGHAGGAINTMKMHKVTELYEV